MKNGTGSTTTTHKPHAQSFKDEALGLVEPSGYRTRLGDGNCSVEAAIGRASRGACPRKKSCNILRKEPEVKYVFRLGHVQSNPPTQLQWLYQPRSF
ncbi:MAG: hypothetical protein ACI9B9_001786 [Halioglobus sp.]|jgi:hypothetical protein